jgi:hypothetical protein
VRSRVSSCEFPSETGLLVDACIARVRELAQLDEEVVLPPLPRVTPRHGVVILTKEDVAGIRAGSPATHPPGASAGDALGASLELGVERISPRSAPRRSSHAALFFCVFVASAFASAAFFFGR